jgi:hypothetical protein
MRGSSTEDLIGGKRFAGEFQEEAFHDGLRHAVLADSDMSQGQATILSCFKFVN